LNRVISVIILLLLYPAINYGQSEKKFTLEIFEQRISGELEKFFYYPDVNRNLQFVFIVTAKNDKEAINTRFITSVIKKTAEKDNIRYSFANNTESLSKDSNYYIIRINNFKLQTKYPKFIKNKFLGDKTLERDISGNINVDMQSADNSFSHNENIIINYRDVIEYDTYESYETAEYEFTKAKPPKVSALESVIFPVLLVTISAAATILFFTIRSK